MAEKTKKPTTKKAVTKRAKTPISLSVSVITTTGNKSGTVTLPSQVFNSTVNQALLAQAARVYRANKRQGTSSVKTRGEVKYSTRKIYRQKGTGRARHGSRKAPIFVGGGITFGPSPRDYSLKLTTKMRKKALFCALTQKTQEKLITVVNSVEKVGPKTKSVIELLKKLKTEDKKKTLFAVDAKRNDFVRATRNIPYVSVVPARELTALDVLMHTYLVFEKSALATFDATKTK